MIIERKKYLDKLIARIDNKMIKVITGDKHIIGLSRETRRN